MRKSTIGLLVGVMIFAFAGLLFLQVNYIREIIRNQDEQFDEAVKRSLSDVAYNLELKEASQLFRENALRFGTVKSSISQIDNILTNDKSTFVLRSSESWIEKFDFNLREDNSIIRGTGKSSLSSQSQSIQKMQTERYFYAENVLNEVIRQLLKAEEKPIEERIDFKQLRIYIETELANNNLALPFQYAVIDNNRNIVYKSPNYEVGKDKKVFPQILFPGDTPSKLHMLQVVFPTKNKFVLSFIRFIAPSIIFSTLLLVVFTVTLYIILRQKHTSEMKKDFVSNMTHELKTPVASISIAGQMLSDRSLIATLEQSGSLSQSASFNKIIKTIAYAWFHLQLF